MLFAAHLGHHVSEGHSCRSAAPRHRRPPRRLCRGRTCPRTTRQPSRGAPASGGRRCAARRPPWPRPAARHVRTRWPPSAPRAARVAAGLQPPRPREPNDVDIGRFGQLPRAAAKSARRQLPRSRAVEDGGGDLAQRGVGRPRARPALGGAAGRLGARAAALKRPKIAAAGLGDLESASLRPVRAPARLSRGSPTYPGAVLNRGAERGAAAVEPGPWRLRDEPNRAPQRWRSKQSPAAARSCAASPQRFCAPRPRLS